MTSQVSTARTTVPCVARTCTSGHARVRPAVYLKSRHESSSASSSAPVGQVLGEQQLFCDHVCHLEHAYLHPSAVPSPQPAYHQQQQPLPAASAPAATEAGVLAGAAPASATAVEIADWRSRLRGTYIRNALPVIRTIRRTEKKLEADLLAVHYAIILMFAVILYDRGWNNFMDRFDDSTLGDICSIMVGLGMVLGVKLMGWQPKDYFNV